MAEVNVTPFTDVLLVLLIIFMILAALTVPPGFERQFTNCACSTAPPKAQPNPIAVTVTRAGAIFVQGKAVGAAALYGVLAQMHARAPRAKIALYADVKSPYGIVIRVLDAAKAGGVPDVLFATQ